MLLLVTGVKDANQGSAIKVGQLLLSARDVVGGLTAAEEEFVDGLEEGRCAEWKTKQTLRGALIRRICTDAHARDAVKVPAVYLQNVEIQGILDPTFAVVPWPLLMTNCAVCDDVRLLYATTKLLNFDNSTIGQFDAGGVRIDGNLWLRNARISRGLKLSLAEIAGNLECDGAELSAGADGVAFRAEQMHVAGSMMLRCIYKAGRQKRFVATGMTRLNGARIDVCAIWQMQL